MKRLQNPESNAVATEVSMAASIAFSTTLISSTRVSPAKSSLPSPSSLSFLRTISSTLRSGFALRSSLSSSSLAGPSLSKLRPMIFHWLETRRLILRLRLCLIRSSSRLSSLNTLGRSM
ncbi:uncharacterized protein LOC130501330 [Raphanus sativus]|uniref:Uncharacterized protein LOC130501330 n=1 Tax=Raphanus sativus TaxID=3726 RepID=A0A9W3CKQ3_RAPSA|nr:uncharacterized protein LOC130501330 [Raphanus sativus]